MAAELNLTEEQKEAMETLRAKGPPQSPEQGESRFEEMQSILTPEQQSAIQAGMHSRRQHRRARHQAKARRTLPPDQLKIFEERLEERDKEFERGGFRGPGGGPPPQGPPPFPPPPPGGGPW
jgi:hypothetical protein